MRRMGALLFRCAIACCRKKERSLRRTRGGGAGSSAAVKRAATSSPPRTYRSRRSPRTCRSPRTWRICTRRAGKLNKARSRLYRSHILQLSMRWKALAEIYTMHSFAQSQSSNFCSNITAILVNLSKFHQILTKFCQKFTGIFVKIKGLGEMYGYPTVTPRLSPRVPAVCIFAECVLWRTVRG